MGLLWAPAWTLKALRDLSETLVDHAKSVLEIHGDTWDGDGIVRKGFQMHARFPLIARTQDHYTWIPKINMAVAVR